MGPFTLEKLKLKPLRESTMLLHKDLKDWTEAMNIVALKDHFENNNPTKIPKAIQIPSPSHKYNQTSLTTRKMDETPQKTKRERS